MADNQVGTKVGQVEDLREIEETTFRWLIAEQEKVMKDGQEAKQEEGGKKVPEEECLTIMTWIKTSVG